MMTGSFDPIAQGETFVWSHDLIADDDGTLMNIDECQFFVNVTSRRYPCPDYGFIAPWSCWGMSCWANVPVLQLDNASIGGILMAQEGTIVATILGTTTRTFPRGDNRLTLDVTRYGETVRLVDMAFPVLGY